MPSRSRSRSRDRYDRFGRVIPRRRSRSRSPRYRRSRSRSGSIKSRDSRRRSGSRGRRSPRRSPRVIRRSRSRSRSSSRRRKSPRPRSKTPPIGNRTNINDIELMKARVFVGNVPVQQVTKKELEDIFTKYGKIIGLSLHDRGFAFVQYEKEEEALKAVENENAGLLKGSKLDVKMALDGRRGPGPKPAPERRSPSVPGAQPYDRERYPPPAAPMERERSPLRADPYDDRYRDAYRDPPPPRRDDPYADPYRRPPPPVDDPYYDRYREDPYRYPPPPPRRDPYADPYRDPYYRDPVYDAPRKPPPPLDCQIIILNSALMKFAEFIERKLKMIQVFCTIGVITEDRTIPQMVEDAAKRQCLFAVVINSQNEAHQSLTVNILHGTPQEHRNMPVDDAVNLIKRSFDAYQAAKREKEAALARPAAPAVRAPPPFVPPSQDIIYLLNLLADKRQLTVEELDKVISYLTERRDKLLEAEGRLPSKGYDGDQEQMSERHHARSLESAVLYTEPSVALRASTNQDTLTKSDEPIKTLDQIAAAKQQKILEESAKIASENSKNSDIFVENHKKALRMKRQALIEALGSLVDPASLEKVLMESVSQESEQQQVLNVGMSNLPEESEPQQHFNDGNNTLARFTMESEQQGVHNVAMSTLTDESEQQRFVNDAMSTLAGLTQESEQQEFLNNAMSTLAGLTQESEQQRVLNDAMSTLAEVIKHQQSLLENSSSQSQETYQAVQELPENNTQVNYNKITLLETVPAVTETYPKNERTCLTIASSTAESYSQSQPIFSTGVTYSRRTLLETNSSTYQKKPSFQTLTYASETQLQRTIQEVSPETTHHPRRTLLESSAVHVKSKANKALLESSGSKSSLLPKPGLLNKPEPVPTPAGLLETPAPTKPKSLFHTPEFTSMETPAPTKPKSLLHTPEFTSMETPAPTKPKSLLHTPEFTGMETPAQTKPKSLLHAPEFTGMDQRSSKSSVESRFGPSLLKTPDAEKTLPSLLQTPNLSHSKPSLTPNVSHSRQGSTPNASQAKPGVSHTVSHSRPGSTPNVSRAKPGVAHTVSQSKPSLLSMDNSDSRFVSSNKRPVQAKGLLQTPGLLTTATKPSLLTIESGHVSKRLKVADNDQSFPSHPDMMIHQEVGQRNNRGQMRGATNTSMDEYQGVVGNKADGPPVLQAIADVVQTVCTTTANMFQLVDKYNVPENCLFIKPPLVSPLLQSFIGGREKSEDSSLQNIQMQMALAIVPLVQTCAFFENSMSVDNEVVYQLLKDSMLLLSNLMLELTVKRRHQIRFSMPKHERWMFVRKMTIGKYFIPEEYLKNLGDGKALKQAFDKNHKTSDEEKHVFAQQLLNKKRSDDSKTDIRTWSLIAEFVNLCCTSAVNQKLVKHIKEKYPIPENCQCLKPPICNESIFTKLENQVKNQDRDLHNFQRLIGHAIVPIIKMLESIKFVHVKPLEMFSMLKETLYILCTTIREISSMRRRYLRMALPEQYKSRVDRCIPITRRLDGDSAESYGGGEPKTVDAQKDLQAKILSILNGPGEGPGSVPPPQSHGNGALDHRQGSGGMSSLINLDNPNIQKALDNLIQSGPNLLKTLSNAPGPPTQQGAALMSRESQHTQPQASMGREPGYPPPRTPGMPPGARPQYPGAQPRMGAPGGMPPRRPGPPPQY